MEEKLTLRNHLEKVLACETKDVKDDTEVILFLADLHKAAGRHKDSKNIAKNYLEMESRTGQFEWLNNAEQFILCSRIELSILKEQIRRFYTSQNLNFNREYFDDKDILDFTRSEDKNRGTEVSIRKDKEGYMVRAFSD
jgi:hypothetical protein